jgi:hypothetical protein
MYNANKEGLMIPDTRTQSQRLNAVRKALMPSQTPQTLEERIDSLSEAEIEFITRIAGYVRAAASMGPSFGQAPVPYAQLVQSMYPAMSRARRSLIAEILQDADPIDVPEQPDHSETARVSAQNAVLDSYAAALAYKRPPQPEQPPVVSEQPATTGNDDFLARLTQSESSGDSKAELTIKDGRTFVGSLQFGSARLADFKKHSGKRFTQDEFKADPALQDEVAKWHIADIDKSIDALGHAAKSYDRDGLRSVAHLGGKGGMKRFVQSGGQYNPSDELGTSLQSYYDKFSAKRGA